VAGERLQFGRHRIDVRVRLVDLALRRVPEGMRGRVYELEKRLVCLGPWRKGRRSLGEEVSEKGLNPADGVLVPGQRLGKQLADLGLLALDDVPGRPRPPADEVHLIAEAPEGV